MAKTKLELTWIGKDNRPRLEPRILLEDPDKSYHAPHRVTDNDIFDNRLIFGDNLLALKALEQEFAGKVKCIYIDPPFNTQQAMEHYKDGLEHSLWLTLIRDRLNILHRLLTTEGTAHAVVQPARGPQQSVFPACRLTRPRLAGLPLGRRQHLRLRSRLALTSRPVPFPVHEFRGKIAKWEKRGN